MRKILVTSALPYANGSIHLGHLVEYLQTDIWVRHQKMSNNHCTYICADDAHGTPIMLKARELNITPEKLIEKSKKEHIEDLQIFILSLTITTQRTQKRTECYQNSFTIISKVMKQ